MAELESDNQELSEQFDEASTTTPSTTAATPAPAPTARDVSVLSITDGDTMRVLIHGVNEPLRLIGINAPEDGECLSSEAARRLGELVESPPIVLESDVSDRDQHGRLLRYAYAGGVFVNEVLVEEGLAIARRYEPDTARAAELEAAQARAETNGLGMWAPDACGDPSSGAIQIGDIHPDADGDDNLNLNDEWVEVVNAGTGRVDLTGWSLKDESASHRYEFPSGFTLEAGATVRLHTGCGDDSSASLFWCSQGSAVWNNSGDTVFVLDPSGNVVASRSYRG